VTVGIWGSCVTRDTFEIGGSFNGPLAYHARSSWVSQATSAEEQPPVSIPTGAGFADRMVREDLEKSVLSQLATKNPDVVVIDLIDERFDLVSVGGAYYSMNDYYERLELEPSMREASEDVLAFRDDARDKAFAEAVRQLVPQWLEALPETRFVLHLAWYTARSADPERPFYASAPTAVAWCNERLAHHYRCLIEAFGGRLHVVEADRERFLVADPEHRWGLAHYHYVPDYYAEILTQILEVRVGADLTRTSLSVVTPTPEECGAATVPPRPDASAVATARPGALATVVRRASRRARRSIAEARRALRRAARRTAR
jgi:hypothetical protein